MAQTHLFRNDGKLMFEDKSVSLDYIDPGIVLLYADTEQQVVCSYLEGRLGQPIQATVEHTFDDEIKVSEVKTAIEGMDLHGFRLDQAPCEDTTHPRWALYGLTEESLRIGDFELHSIRQIVDNGGLWADPSDIFDTSLGDEKNEDHYNLDFAVADIYDGARFFKFLTEELTDTGLTVALSKAGRISELQDTDIVIHIDDDRLDQNERVVPIKGTKDLFDENKAALRRSNFRDKLSGPLNALAQAWQDELSNPDALAIDEANAEVRKMLNRGLLRSTGLKTVSTRKAWLLRGAVMLIGLIIGFISGVVGSETIYRLQGSVSKHIYTLFASGGTLSKGFASVSSIASGPIVIGIPIISTGVLVSLSALKYYHERVTDNDSDVLGTKADFVSLTLTFATILSLIGLLVSVLFFWVGA